MSTASNETYSVPARFRRMENLHILFWLIKDICWCLSFKPLGIAMIFPTFIMALYITWHNRSRISELAHNLAMALWILANSLWMIFEFAGIDEELKYYCLVPFSAGLAILLYYYLLYAPLHRKKILIASAPLAAIQQEAPAVERITKSN